MKIYDIYFHFAYRGYQLANSADEAIRKAAGPNGDLEGFKAILQKWSASEGAQLRCVR